jgi:hypothetical protein
LSLRGGLIIRKHAIGVAISANVLGTSELNRSPLI